MLCAHHPCPVTHTKQDEPILVLGMLRIIKEASVWIAENALGFFEPDPVLGAVAFVLLFVPVEPQHI